MDYIDGIIGKLTAL